MLCRFAEPPQYPPDVVTPLQTLRDAIQAQIARARALQQECETPLRRAA
jgi:hypothetical protein